MIELIKQPWPWYVSGSMIGLVVPTLLLMGNKSFGISSTFRDICAVYFPAHIPFFLYDWKKELWNMALVVGIVVGSALAIFVIGVAAPSTINPQLSAEILKYGIKTDETFMPINIFGWHEIFSPRGFLLMVVGGFLVGFGARYAEGCTSGHVISGLSTLQWPSLVASLCFMLGGMLMSNLILPVIMSL